VTSSAGPALDLPGRLLYRTKSANPLLAALLKLHSAEAGANAAIDRFNRGQGSAATVQAKVGAARSAASSLRGPFNIDLRRATSEARAAVKIVTGRELPARHG